MDQYILLLFIIKIHEIADPIIGFITEGGGGEGGFRYNFPDPLSNAVAGPTQKSEGQIYVLNRKSRAPVHSNVDFDLIRRLDSINCSFSPKH